MITLHPSRVAVVVFSLSLLSFLWIFGLPHQSPQPSFPIISHDGPPQTPPLDDLEKPDHSSEPGHALDLSTSLLEATSTQIQGDGPAPTISAVSSVKGEEQDKGHASSGKEKQQGASDTPIVIAPTPSVTAQNDTAEATSSSITSIATPTRKPAPVKPLKFCKEAHGAPNVMVVIKTSAGETADKLPTHLKTLLECVPHFLIFSDRPGNTDGIIVHDALASISNATKEKHKEFNQYEKLQTQKAGEIKAGSVDKELEKWKMLPMVYKAYMMRPNMRWYMFIEADTSLSWTNLLQWVDRLDYRIPYYAGAPTFLGNTKFVQRGPGILVSFGAMRLYAKSYEERYVSKWEARVAKECCGDLVLATAMNDAHVELYSAFPLLQGETPTSLDWTGRNWCTPVISWHHMNKQAIESVWSAHHNWTSHYGWEEPYLFRNAYAEMIDPQLADFIEDWDNISSDTKIVKPPGPDTKDDKEHLEWAKHSEELRKSVGSPENCRRVCLLAEDCLQWKFTPKGDGECHLGKVIRLGSKVEKKDGKPVWTSGWMLERITKETVKWDAECKEAKWKFNQ
jgi:hypothetical protein